MRNSEIDKHRCTYTDKTYLDILTDRLPEQADPQAGMQLMIDRHAVSRQYIGKTCRQFIHNGQPTLYSCSGRGSTMTKTTPAMQLPLGT